MDPSPVVCSLHPGVAVTGFCPACLRDRLVGLHSPSSADLRRCKSFSYARSAAVAVAAAEEPQPHRRSCDHFRQEQHLAAALPLPVPEEEQHSHSHGHGGAEASRRSLGGLLGKKLHLWRRNKQNNKPKKQQEPPPDQPGRLRHRQPSFSEDPRPSWSSALARAMLSVPVEGEAVPRSDGQIPVEEDYLYHHDDDAAPGGSSQTREYYLDSSSSGRRRRSLDRSANASELQHPPRVVNANARVSPAMAAELYHAQQTTQSVLVHHHHLQYNDFSGSLGPRLQGGVAVPSKSKSWWNIFGLMNKKSSKQRGADGPFSAAAASTQQGGYAWAPELRARGYNGQMLRCNSTVSARSSFSGGIGGTAMIGGSARRSVSGLEMPHDDVSNGGHGFGRRDEVLLERTLSTRSSATCYSREPQLPPPHLDQHHRYHNGGTSGRRRSSNKPSCSLPRRSTLGDY